MKVTFRKVKNLFAASALQMVFLYLLMGQVLLPGVVLCLEIDGRVTLEAASKEFGCGSFLETDSRKNANSLSTAESHYDKAHCGTCTDIPISVDASERDTIPAYGSVSEIKSSVFAPSLISLPRFVELATEGLLPQPPPAVNPTVAFLRTTILLC